MVSMAVTAPTFYGGTADNSFNWALTPDSKAQTPCLLLIRPIEPFPLRILYHPSARKKARIKKIMQADEDLGKIAMAVPLLIFFT